MNRLVAIIFILVFTISVYAQDATSSKEVIPNGFQGVVLGLSLDDAKAALFNHPYLLFRGDPDVSLLSRKDERLIQCEGSEFVDRAVIQLKDNEVYLISFMLNRDFIDYYTMYRTLAEKYGEPNSLSPTEAVWEDGSVRMSLEKPLTVKYLSMKMFSDIIAASEKEQSLNAKSREDFLEGF